MEQPMAVVRLAPGEVGFFDPVSLIHLTLSNPSVAIRPGQNIDRIRRAVKAKHLLLVSGSLEPEAAVAAAKPGTVGMMGIEPKVKLDTVAPPADPEPEIAVTVEPAEKAPTESAEAEAAQDSGESMPDFVAAEEQDAEEIATKGKRKRKNNQTA